MLNQITINENAAFYQTQPSSNTSDKYKPISTKEVTDFFLNNGFHLSGYQQANTIKPDYHGKSKHIVRLRPLSAYNSQGELISKQGTPEIVIYNSHNKYTSLKLNIGIYRLICANGMVMGDEFFQGKVNHIGQNLNQNLEELLVATKEKFKEVYATIDKLQSTQLDLTNQRQLVEAAFNTRKSSDKQFLTFEDIKKNLQPTRLMDEPKDLYTQMNILQEKLIRGGFQYSFRNDKNQVSTKKFNRTNDITAQEKINKNLFNYAMAV